MFAAFFGSNLDREKFFDQVREMAATAALNKEKLTPQLLIDRILSEVGGCLFVCLFVRLFFSFSFLISFLFVSCSCSLLVFVFCVVFFVLCFVFCVYLFLFCLFCFVFVFCFCVLFFCVFVFGERDGRDRRGPHQTEVYVAEREYFG